MCKNNKFNNQMLRIRTMKTCIFAIACLLGMSQAAYAQTKLTAEQIQSDIVGH